MLARVAAIARHPVALWVTGLAVGIWAVARVTRFRAGAPFTLWGDASIVYDKSLEILHTTRYPASVALGNFNEVFPYPPPASVIFGALASLGAPIFMLLWTSLIVVGLFAVFRLSVANELPEIRRAFIALMPIVIVMAHNPVGYDLVNNNNNLIVLALVMGSFALMPRAPIAAGILLALPIAIKLYSAALLLWAIVYRPRAAIVCVTALVVLWLLLPLGLFGAADMVALYRGWLDQVAIVNHPWVYTLPAGTGPPLISLRRAAAWLSGAPPFATPSAIALFAMQAAWLVVLIAYGWFAVWLGKVTATSRAALADWTVLLLAPLPFSPWLEPYHGVGMIPAFILCVLMIFGDDTPRRARIIAGTVVVATLVLKALGTPFEIRGLLYLVEFILLTLALAWMRSELARADARAPMPEHQAVAGGNASTE